ncbi:MAG: RNA-directed DNA polymerase [Acidobacteria bacterium]|nr:RNA-directed DNA polymerase [Acidobacteriota bacterium]
MRREGHIFERVASFDALWRAAERACRGHLDRPAVARFWFHAETEVLRLEEELLAGAYRPRPYTTFLIREPKERLISAADIRDRVVHHALCGALEPTFERRAIAASYACRVGKGSHAAVAHAHRLSRRYPFVVKCDVRRFFASVDHEALLALVARLVKDARVLALVELIVRHGAPGAEPGKGLPIGNLTSQYFANLYLGELDHFVTDRLGVGAYVRYMDDFLFFGRAKAPLWEHLGAVRALLAEKLRLDLNEARTRLAPVTEGIGFLGFRVFPGTVRLAGPKLARMRRTVAARERAFLAGQIGEDDLARSVASVVAHAASANTLAARRRAFERSLSLG